EAVAIPIARGDADAAAEPWADRRGLVDRHEVDQLDAGLAVEDPDLGGDAAQTGDDVRGAVAIDVAGRDPHAGLQPRVIGQELLHQLAVGAVVHLDQRWDPGARA